ncbi:uncharacterized protein LOC131656451 [Vicia villosa]|uniref:uncharacterized protein LOC131656451 n=1 Tax=Vicia villosa TaxID=3911 RepID=UPI00273CBF25|nr:uncharacterized protein LOC131656451 [Vicia villosa]
MLIIYSEMLSLHYKITLHRISFSHKLVFMPFLKIIKGKLVNWEGSMLQPQVLMSLSHQSFTFHVISSLTLPKFSLSPNSHSLKISSLIVHSSTPTNTYTATHSTPFKNLKVMASSRNLSETEVRMRHCCIPTNLSSINE